MSDMLKHANYYTAQAWMVTELGLTGDELTVFAILWGFSQDGNTTGRTPKQYFMEWTGKGSDATIRTVKSLIEKGLVERICEDGKTPEYRCKMRPIAKCDPSQNATPRKMRPLAKCDPSQNATPRKMRPLPIAKCDPYPSQNATPINNNNINNKENNNTPALAREEIKEDLTFLSWWKLYNNQIIWQENECAAIWDAFTPETRAAIMRHTRRIVEHDSNKKKEPKWYLRDRRWENDHPKWFAGSPAESAAYDLVQVKWNDRYLITTREQAQAYNLEIIKDWK